MSANTHSHSPRDRPGTDTRPCREEPPIIAVVSKTPLPTRGRGGGRTSRTGSPWSRTTVQTGKRTAYSSVCWAWRPRPSGRGGNAFLLPVRNLQKICWVVKHGQEHGDAGVQVPLLPHGCAGSGAVAHPRVRAHGLQHGPVRTYQGVVPAPGAGELQRHLGDADRVEKGRRSGLPQRGLLGPSPTGPEAPTDGVSELLRQARPVPAIQVAQEVQGVGGVHTQRIPVPGREADVGEDELAAGHRVVASSS